MTGASSGIGRAVALALAHEGARVQAIARSRDKLESLAGELAGGAQGTIVPCALDLTDDQELERAIADWRNAAEPVDLLVHSAGVIRHAETRDASLEDLEQQLAVNFRAPYRLTQALLPQLIKGQGDVAFMNSSATRYPRSYSGQYAAVAHAQLGFADSLREELNPLGVRVLSIFPGKTATPLQEQLHAASGAAYAPEHMLQPEDVASILIAALALPRTAEVTEIRIRPRQKG